MKTLIIKTGWRGYLAIGSFYLLVILTFCSYLFGPPVAVTDEPCVQNYLGGCDY